MKAAAAGAVAGTLLVLGGAWLLIRASSAPSSTVSAPPAVSRQTKESAWLTAGHFDAACIAAREPVTVRGDSLGALALHGEQLELLRGYYQCNRVKRGEVVALAHGPSGTPLAKVIHAVPGDAFSVTLMENAFRLIVNGEPARNSQGQPFFIDEQARRLLQHYAHSHQGEVPEAAVLLLSDKPTGTVDGRRFGLVPQAELLGRLVR